MSASCDIGGWLVYKCKCKSCFKAWVATAPTSADLEKLECPRCGKFNSKAEVQPKKEGVRT